jgi:hypothetical protein
MSTTFSGGWHSLTQAGCESIEVFSTVDLFGPHVVQTHEEGRFTVKMANPKKVLTCQIGKNHLGLSSPRGAAAKAATKYSAAT